MGKVRFAAALVLLPTVACTALLGDFQVGASSTPTDGGGDGQLDGMTTTDGPSDSGADAFDAQSTVFTTCGVSSTRVIDTLPDAAMGFDGALEALHVGNAVRVVVQRATSAGAWVYSFDPKQGMPGTPINAQVVDLSGAGRYLDARRATAQQIVALLFLENDPGAPVARMKVYELPDTDLTAFQSFRASQDFPAPSGNSNISGALGVYQQNNEYFWALSTQSPGVPGNADVRIGHRVTAAALPAPVTIFTGNDRDARVRDLARSGKIQYIFNDRGPDMPGDPGSGYFAVPDDTVTGPINLSSLSPPGGKAFATLGVSGIATGDGLRGAFAEIDFAAGGGSPGLLRIGTIPGTALPSFNGTVVPSAFTLGSLLEAPIGNLEARFFGDDLLWIGTPPDPQRGQGLNFIWYNSTDCVTRSKQVGANKLLANHTTIGRASVALANATAFTADIDLVFTEVINGASVLQYAAVNCVK